ncbi:hypothetical protein CCP3SC1AL1_3400001 [Gammaproteobacteria bacterium]
MVLDPKRAFDCHGRGIALAKLVGFDWIEYHGNGNEVLAGFMISPSTLTGMPI